MYESNEIVHSAYNSIVEELSAQNEEAITYDGFESALVGIASRFGMPSVALYDYNACIAILMNRDGMDSEEAAEFFEFNVIGGWNGDSTPCFGEIMKMIKDYDDCK